VLSFLVEVYIFLILAYVILSWIPEMRYQSWYRALGSMVEPYLSIFRRIIPPAGGMIDFSPVAGMIVLILFERLLKMAGL